MRTTNNAQKTKNRKFAAGTLALALILATANSNGQSKEQPKSLVGENQIAFAAPNFKSEKDTQAKNGKLDIESTAAAEFMVTQPEIENSLQTEAWMLDNKYFTTVKPEFGTDTETPLKIERWMTNKQIWNK